MNLEFKQLIPEGFAPDSRVWVYQSSRVFSVPEALEIETLLNQFASTWLSHGEKVKAFATLFFGRFIVLMADESSTSVGGCSTDASVRFIKQLEQRFDVEFLNRTSLAFVVKDRIEAIPLSQLGYAVENGFITADTLFFNNVVTTLRELENHWLIPAGRSWLGMKFRMAQDQIS